MTEAQELQRRTARPRLFQLDALRGIAAVIVVLHHGRWAYNNHDAVWYLRPFFAGTQSVSLFFVLSGYVLSLPFWAGRQESYPKYLVRRVCRIYLPYAAAAVLAIVCAAHFEGRWLPLPPWFFRTWQTPVTARLVGEQMLMWPMAVFNTAFWSLSFEMLLSIVLPFCLMLMRGGGALPVTAVSCLLVYARPVLLKEHVAPLAAQAMSIACLFFMGATLARHASALVKTWEKLGRWAWLVLLLSLELLWQPVALPDRFFSTRSDLVWGVGAAGIVLSALYLKPFARRLEAPALEYLGRISYSLYLTHGTVLFALLDLFYWRLSRPLLSMVFLVSSFVIAHLFCLAVEEPSIVVGKRIAKAF